MTPLRYHGKPVWLGQISRDIGVRWTWKTANFTTHKINPNVDEARAYLIRDLMLGQAVKWWGFVTGTAAAPYHEPRRNLTGDPYYTDGLRAVIELSSGAVNPAHVIQKAWEDPPDKAIPLPDPAARSSSPASAELTVPASISPPRGRSQWLDSDPDRWFFLPPDLQCGLQ